MVTLNNDDIFGDVVDTPKEGIEQHKNRECLKSVIDNGKVHLLGHKWTHGRVDKTNDEIINKTHAEYRQRELTKKVKKWKGLGQTCHYSILYRNFSMA